MILDDDRFGPRDRGQYDPDPDDTEPSSGVELNGDLDDDEPSPRAFLATLGLGANTMAAVQARRARGPSPELVDLIAKSKSPSTRATYTKALTHFAIWFTDIYLDAGNFEVPEEYMFNRIAYVALAEPVDVAEYVNDLATKHWAPATIKKHVAAIGHAFKLLGKPRPMTHEHVSEAVAGATNSLGAKQRQVEPLMLDQLRHIVVGLPIVRTHAPPGQVRRDQLLLLLGWAGALRASELVALDVEHLSFVDEPDRGTGGLIVRIDRSKTDQAGHGATITIPYSSSRSACPVRAALYHVRDIKTGPLFCNIDRHGRRRANRGNDMRLGVDNVGRIVKRSIIDVYGGTVDERLYSSHSLRAGFVTEAANHEVSDRTIAQTTRHEDLNVLRRYDRPEQTFTTGALAGEWW